MDRVTFRGVSASSVLSSAHWLLCSLLTPDPLMPAKDPVVWFVQDLVANFPSLSYPSCRWSTCPHLPVHLHVDRTSPDHFDPQVENQPLPSTPGPTECDLSTWVNLFHLNLKLLIATTVPVTHPCYSQGRHQVVATRLPMGIVLKLVVVK